MSDRSSPLGREMQQRYTRGKSLLIAVFATLADIADVTG
jgi:hypothetical protein